MERLPVLSVVRMILLAVWHYYWTRNVGKIHQSGTS